MSWDPQDEIGYGKPPRYTRFKKGRSGNPQGRPRSKQRAAVAPPSTEFDDILRELNNEKIPVKIRGKVQKIPAFKAVALRQRADAISGSVTAQREVTRNKEKLDERDALRALAEAEKKEIEVAEKERDDLLQYDYLMGIHAEQARVYQQAAETGCNPDPKYPHPDDFHFDHREKRATVYGPWNETDAYHFRQIAKTRDYHAVDHVILVRQRPKGTWLKLQMSHFQMVGYDAMLPHRMRICGEALDDCLTLLFMLPMADLRDWRRDLDRWLKLNPMPKPSKKIRRDTYKEVNALMKPMLKPVGFRSLAQLERHCEEEEEMALRARVS